MRAARRHFSIIALALVIVAPLFLWAAVSLRATWFRVSIHDETDIKNLVILYQSELELRPAAVSQLIAMIHTQESKQENTRHREIVSIKGKAPNIDTRFFGTQRELRHGNRSKPVEVGLNSGWRNAQRNGSPKRKPASCLLCGSTSTYGS